MPVGYFHQKRYLSLQPEGIDDIRKFSSELLRQKHDTDALVFEDLLQFFPKLLSLVNHHTVNSCQAHPRIGIHIIADEIHFHGYRLLRIPRYCIR